MDYSEVVSAFSQLVETHFLQRCPPVASTGSSNPEVVDNPPPAVAQPSEPESHPDCYRVPYINLTGQLLLSKYEIQKYSNTLRQKLKRLNCVFIQVKENADAQVRMVKLTSVQRKKPKQTTMRYYDRDDDITHSRLHQLSFSSVLSLFLQCGDEGIFWQVNFERFHLHFRDQAIISAVSCKLDQVTI